MIANRPTHAWTELRVSSPAQQHAAVLARGIGPFLQNALPGLRSHFIPEPERASIRVYVEGDDPRLPSSLHAFLRNRGLVTETPGVSAAAGTCTTVHEVQFTGTGAQALIDDFLVDTTPFVLDLLETITATPASRLQVALEMMLAQPFVLKTAIFEGSRALAFPLAYVSYRAHVDGFFLMTKDPSATKQAFEARSMHASVAATRRLASLARRAEDQTKAPEPSARWADFVAIYLHRVLEELRSGALVVTMGDETGSIGDAYDLSVSPFHQAVHENAPLRARMPTHPEFNAMRVLASLLYVTLHRIGVRLIDRYLLCYITARTFESAFDIDPVDAVGHLAVELSRTTETASTGGEA